MSRLKALRNFQMMDMNSSKLEINNSFEFLRTKYGYSIVKNKNPWYIGIEFIKNDLFICILYDKREKWFDIRLFSKSQKKVHMYLIGELRNHFATL
ncbi:MAG: hypothetical protein K2X37_07595 [Chitinophagaceae bacterium]|nr:hypothetical protein [Chitinophagaceae bacterium]